ncbi:MAG: hypothetical protein QM811_06905 [Pirellulales bacterium]
MRIKAGEDYRLLKRGEKAVAGDEEYYEDRWNTLTEGYEIERDYNPVRRRVDQGVNDLTLPAWHHTVLCEMCGVKHA